MRNGAKSKMLTIFKEVFFYIKKDFFVFPLIIVLGFFVRILYPFIHARVAAKKEVVVKTFIKIKELKKDKNNKRIKKKKARERITINFRKAMPARNVRETYIFLLRFLTKHLKEPIRIIRIKRKIPMYSSAKLLIKLFEIAVFSHATLFKQLRTVFLHYKKFFCKFSDFRWYE